MRPMFLSILTILAMVISGCEVNVSPTPKPEPDVVILHAGSPVVITKNSELPCRLLKDPNGQTFVFDVGAWVAMPPAHWEYIRQEIIDLRNKLGESSKDSGDGTIKLSRDKSIKVSSKRKGGAE